MSWVSSRAKMMPVSGERIVPPSTAAMLTSGQSAASPPGRNGETIAPSAPPMISSGASTPPEVPEPSAIDQISPLTTISPTSADGT